jgi:hypothetical protein
VLIDGVSEVVSDSEWVGGCTEGGAVCFSARAALFARISSKRLFDEVDAAEEASVVSGAVRDAVVGVREAVDPLGELAVLVVFLGGLVVLVVFEMPAL